MITIVVNGVIYYAFFQAAMYYNNSIASYFCGVFGTWLVVLNTYSYIRSLNHGIY